MINPDEKSILDHLSAAYNEFVALKDFHPMSNQEFASAIHICQNLIAVRVAARDDPSIWTARDWKTYRLELEFRKRKQVFPTDHINPLEFKKFCEEMEDEAKKNNID